MATVDGAIVRFQDGCGSIRLRFLRRDRFDHAVAIESGNGVSFDKAPRDGVRQNHGLPNDPLGRAEATIEREHTVRFMLALNDVRFLGEKNLHSATLR